MNAEMGLTAPRARSVTERSRDAWDERQIAVIANTVAIGATLPQLHMFLEVAAKYDLDPLTKEIWCAVPKNRDGSYNADRVLIMVGRDGFLKIAQRSGEFEGMESDTVRMGDKFETERMQNGTRRVKHSYGVERGAIIGAWAIVHRTKRKPTYFFARIEEYEPDGDYKTPWKKQKSAMIMKVAEVSALRRAFSISGVVSEEEVALQLMPGLEESETAAPSAPKNLLDHVHELFEQTRFFDPHAFTPAKERLLLAAANEVRVKQIEVELIGWLRDHGAEPKPFAEVVEEEIEDAEVVEPEARDPEPVAGEPKEDGESLASEPEARQEPVAMPPVPESTPARIGDENEVLESARRAAAAHGFELPTAEEELAGLASEPEPEVVEGELDFDGSDEHDPGS